MTLPYQITSENEMNLMLSAQGIIAFADHNRDATSDAGVVLSCINYATSLVFGHLAKKYELIQVASSHMIREIGTVIACRTLCTRRGNDIPASLEMRYQEIIQKDGLLDMISKGLVQLVDDSGNMLLGKSFAPTMSNLVIDRRHLHEKIRVVQQNSLPVDSALERDNSGGMIEGQAHGY